MTGYKQIIGKWGEEAAVSYLVNQGLMVVERNWRSSHGEIDIIARDENGFVFIEVKTRRGDQFGYPENAVTKEKKKHLILCVADYIEEKQIKDEWRIDVVSIRKINNRPLDIEWFQNAVSEE